VLIRQGIVDERSNLVPRRHVEPLPVALQEELEPRRRARTRHSIDLHRRNGKHFSQGS
jgi:hypothetical protein